MRKSNDKEYLHSLYKYENFADKKPDKKIKKYKRKERQRGKSIIKKEVKSL